MKKLIQRLKCKLRICTKYVPGPNSQIVWSGEVCFRCGSAYLPIKHDNNIDGYYINTPLSWKYVFFGK